MKWAIATLFLAGCEIPSFGTVAEMPDASIVDTSEADTPTCGLCVFNIEDTWEDSWLFLMQCPGKVYGDTCDAGGCISACISDPGYVCDEPTHPIDCY